MKSRPRIALGVLTLLASAVVLFVPTVFPKPALDARAPDAVRAHVDAASQRDSLDEVDVTRAHARAPGAPQASTARVIEPRPGELFSNVILVTAVVAGGPPGAAAGTRVRCTPSLGQVIDCTVDANDRFEARGIPAGRVRISCNRDGLWAADMHVVVEDAEPRTNVSVTLHPTRTLRVWIDDAEGRTIDCNQDNIALLERLHVAMSIGAERVGAQLLDARRASGIISQQSSRALVLLQFPTSGERPSIGSEREALYTFEVVNAPGAHMTLTLNGIVVDSVPIAWNVDELHLRFDPQVLAGRMAEIEVIVMRDNTDTPLPNALVQASRDDKPTLWIRARTRADGRALLPFLTRVSYRVYVDDPDHIPRVRRVDVDRDVGTVQVRLGLVRGVTIAGRIDWGGRRSHFAGVECTQVTAGSPPFRPPDRSPRSWSWTAERFEFRGLEPGLYRVELEGGIDGQPFVDVDVRVDSARDVVLKAR